VTCDQAGIGASAASRPIANCCRGR